LKQKVTQKIQGKSDAAPPALPANAQQPVITGKYPYLISVGYLLILYTTKAFQKVGSVCVLYKETIGAVSR
jgi:hypothetical protein